MNIRSDIVAVVVFVIINLVAPIIMKGQNTNHITDFEKARELYNKEKFSLAKDLFDEILDDGSGYIEEVEASYYRALCAIKLFNEDADHLVWTFNNEFPESNYGDQLRFELGKAYFQREKFRDVIKWFEKIDSYDLEEDQFAEYHFKLGYSYYQREELEKARLAFFHIKDVNSDYASPTLYYYSHIHYTQKNYETAIQGFLRLTNDESFGGIVPYYITQIYYQQKKYEKVIEYSPSMMEDVIKSRKGEVARIIGESYFRIDKFEQALNYLDMYFSDASTTSASDKYMLAYCQYKTGDIRQAAGLLEKISNNNSRLSQNALYILGDCYLKLNQKDKARLAFSSASNMEYDKEIKQDALFNYAKVTFELSYSPFNEAIKAFNKYLEEYPASGKSDIVHNYLVQAYLSTKNYKMALRSIEKIEHKSDDVLKAYQQVTFYRGLELYNNLRFKEAVDMLDRSLKYGRFNLLLKARAVYWKGEAFYRFDDYKNARDAYKQFLNTSGAYSLPEYKIAHYNIGYTYFKGKEYTEAGNWFRKYISLASDQMTDYQADAYNRLGDCHFVQASYWNAVEYYQKNIELNRFDVDYAMFQKGLSLGILDRPSKKIDVLYELTVKHQNSAYIDDALYEIGKSYVDLQQPNKAAGYYERILNDFGKSSYMPKTLNQLGLIYYNKDENDEALKYYKRTVTEYPGTIQANDALTGIKNIYLDRNNVDAYFSFVGELGGYADVSEAEQDSLVFKAAENIYMKGNCENAVSQLKKYYSRFPDGIFTLNANFYLGDCYYSSKEFDKALEAFGFVLEKPHNAFTEQALIGAARINYKQDNYDEALKQYTRLERIAELKSHLKEARIGMLRSSYKLENFPEVVENANKVIHTDKVGDEIIREARYKMAKAYRELDQEQSALEMFSMVAQDVSTPEGAESKFRAAELLYEMEDPERAEEEIYDLVDRSTPHQYWMARAFLLLADIFIDRADYFQANHTLQSIIDNYDQADDDIIDKALAKKEKIESLQKDENQAPQLDDVEVDMSADQQLNDKEQ